MTSANPVRVKSVICIPNTRWLNFFASRPWACITRPPTSARPNPCINQTGAPLYSRANNRIRAMGMYCVALECAPRAACNSAFPPSPNATRCFWRLFNGVQRQPDDQQGGHRGIYNGNLNPTSLSFYAAVCARRWTTMIACLSATSSVAPGVGLWRIPIAGFSHAKGRPRISAGHGHRPEAAGKRSSSSRSTCVRPMTRLSPPPWSRARVVAAGRLE